MSKINNQIRPKELNALGYTDNTIKSIALSTISKYCKHDSKDTIFSLLATIIGNPHSYTGDKIWGQLAIRLTGEDKKQAFKVFELKEEPAPVNVFGTRDIEGSAIKQMDIALRLPIARSGALMPDAHAGYGLPIGGVLAVENAVIPYGIGVDIGCRMALSIFDAGEKTLNHHKFECQKALRELTHFGMEGGLSKKVHHDILDHPSFELTALTRQLKSKAARQLGSSGSGNHFVEWGIIELCERNSLGVTAGRYVSLLSHSGSRGLGANIAMHYMNIAIDVCRLPSRARHLAWLDLDSEAGQEYWINMNLAGEYARACHDVIHSNLARAMGFRPVARVENHHNFAWKEHLEGRELVIHRKGATPAGKGELGIIPGSMIHPGFLVSGKGSTTGLNSASHGAGRAMSRVKAKNAITVSGMKKLLDQHDVTLIGGSTEEAPAAYKDIEKVMQAQTELVNVEGKFFPKIVRMNKE